MRNTMHHDVQLSADGRTLAVYVPMQFRKRGGRKVVIAPSGAQAMPQPTSRPSAAAQSSAVDAGLVKAIAQAHRWQAMLDEGRYTTVGDLAKVEKLDKSFVSRTLRLTLLAPNVIEAILDGRQSDAAQRQTLLRGFPLAWEEQVRSFRTS